MFPRVLAFLLALAATSAAATVTPLPGVTPQRALALKAFAVPIAVRVTDSAGRPTPNATVTISALQSLQFELAAQLGCYVEFMSVIVCEATTDAEGVANFGVATANRAGSYPVLATATLGCYPDTQRLGETTLQLTADPAAPVASLAVTQGNDQRVVAGTPLSTITLRLQGPDGTPRRGAPLWYSPITGGAGGFEAPLNGKAEVLTDEGGFATLPRLVAGWGMGAHEAEVRYFDAESASFVTATIRYTATNAQGGLTLQLGDLWWAGAAESGWGMSVFQHDDRLFNVWFVYGPDGQPTWYVQSSGRWSGGVGAYFEGAVHWPRSAPWFAYDASRFEIGAEVGRGRMDFRGTQEAWTGFHVDLRTATIPSLYKNVQRQPFGQGVAAPISGVGDLWWGGPSQNGWGLAIHEQAGTLFMVWFTYDATGKPTWFVMPGGRWSESGAYAGTVYRTTGPYWGSQYFYASGVSTQAVGTFDLRFASTAEARMDLVIDGRSVKLDLVRQGF